MKLKLKNVFLVYFLVSIAGLLYALLQLGERGGRASLPCRAPPRWPEHASRVLSDCLRPRWHGPICPRRAPAPGQCPRERETEALHPGRESLRATRELPGRVTVPQACDTDPVRHAHLFLSSPELK